MVAQRNGKPQHSKRQYEERRFRDFFGEELAVRREAAGLSQTELGERIFCSQTLIAHFEAGRRLPQLADAQRLDKALNTGDLFYRMRKKLDLDAKFVSYFAPVAELEPQAREIHQYAVSLVPGLLQTEEYARAVFWGFETNPVPKAVEWGVSNRMRRASLLDNPEQPLFWVVLNETVIRTEVGGPGVMAAQLRYLAKMIESGRVLVQVLPFSAGAHATMYSMIRLMNFDDQPDLAYVEGVQLGSLKDDPLQVKRCWESYDLARGAALSRPASLALIESTAEEFEQRERKK